MTDEQVFLQNVAVMNKVAADPVRVHLEMDSLKLTQLVMALQLAVKSDRMNVMPDLRNNMVDLTWQLQELLESRHPEVHNMLEANW